MANGKRKRIGQAIKKFVGLTKQGALSRYVGAPGIKKLSTRSLEAAAGKAPTAKTNLAIQRELLRRSLTGR